MIKILIIEDAAFMRVMLKDIIAKAGLTVVGEVENGMEALDKYKELRPDVTTLDITMPEKDGLTALKEIMAFDPEAKVIMCSAMGQQAMVLDAIQSGARDFVVKPFKPERVIEAIIKTAGK